MINIKEHHYNIKQHKPKLKMHHLQIPKPVFQKDSYNIQHPIHKCTFLLP